ncbi:S1 RNA-binding domain-containing protein [bacterium]|nr:MAG: S1 RNA-binding domain-containing protein [bacterium]
MKEASKDIYINSSISSNRIAIVENEQLVELYIDFPNHTKMVGNIYNGLVQNIIPGIEAAFIDINSDVNAFLPLSELENEENFKNISFDDENGKKKNATPKKKNLKIGDQILVQVVKEPFAGKGARITTDMSIPGALIVLIPNQNYIGISRKINDKYERRRLRKMIESFKPKNAGIIIRTTAQGKNEDILKEEFDTLNKQWKDCLKKSKSKKAPKLVHEDGSMSFRVIRDLFDEQVNNIFVDSKTIYNSICNYVNKINPNNLEKINFYNKKRPIFTIYNIEEQISKSLNKKVWLKSGGHLAIDHTEAMIVIDVNSGRYIGKKNHEENSLKINLEAAAECAKQLRLRDIGGLIVIDFIDMLKPENRKKVYNFFKGELKKDSAKVATDEFSKFGLLEMTRQRVRQNLLDTMKENCNVSNGTGKVFKKEIVLTNLENAIKNYKLTNKDMQLDIFLNPEVIDYIEEHVKVFKKKFLWRQFVLLNIKPDKNLFTHQYKIYSKTKKEYID